MTTIGGRWTATLDRQLQFGWAMRAQRLVEGVALLAAFVSGEIVGVQIVFASIVAQVVSPRLVPVAWLVAALAPEPAERTLGDLYFDLDGIRGASAVSSLVFLTGFALYASGWHTAAWVVWAAPAASLLLAPTVGFCAGCWFYVIGRELWRRGFPDEETDERVDIELTPNEPGQ